jgi:hypothetical protein
MEPAAKGHVLSFPDPQKPCSTHKKWDSEGAKAKDKDFLTIASSGSDECCAMCHG